MMKRSLHDLAVRARRRDAVRPVLLALLLAGLLLAGGPAQAFMKCEDYPEDHPVRQGAYCQSQLPPKQGEGILSDLINLPGTIAKDAADAVRGKPGEAEGAKAEQAAEPDDGDAVAEERAEAQPVDAEGAEAERSRRAFEAERRRLEDLRRGMERERRALEEERKRAEAAERDRKAREEERRRAEAEAERRRAEEARRQAEAAEQEAARQREEESSAEEEARRQAEEATAQERQAREEERRRAEAEAERKAAEEAKRRAEEAEQEAARKQAAERRAREEERRRALAVKAGGPGSAKQCLTSHLLSHPQHPENPYGITYLKNGCDHDVEAMYCFVQTGEESREVEDALRKYDEYRTLAGEACSSNALPGSNYYGDRVLLAPKAEHVAHAGKAALRWGACAVRGEAGGFRRMGSYVSILARKGYAFEPEPRTGPLGSFECDYVPDERPYKQVDHYGDERVRHVVDEYLEEARAACKEELERMERSPAPVQEVDCRKRVVELPQGPVDARKLSYAYEECMVRRKEALEQSVWVWIWESWLGTEDETPELPDCEGEKEAERLATEAEEKERARREAEEDRKRREAEEEARLAAEAERKRLEAEEQARLAAEAKRQAVEEAARRKAEAERKAAAEAAARKSRTLKSSGQGRGPIASSLLLLVDTSGSMGSEVGGGNSQAKIEVAKQAAVAALGRAARSGSVEVAVLAFSGDCADPVPQYQDFTTDVDKLAVFINSLEPDGGTPMADALLFANRFMDSHGRAGPSNRMIMLLADGQNDCGDIRQAMASLQAGGTIFRHETVGFGITPNSQASQDLRDIATQTGGAYHHAVDAAQLEDVFMEFVATLTVIDLLGQFGSKARNP